MERTLRLIRKALNAEVPHSSPTRTKVRLAYKSWKLSMAMDVGRQTELPELTFVPAGQLYASHHAKFEAITSLEAGAGWIDHPYKCLALKATSPNGSWLFEKTGPTARPRVPGYMAAPCGS